MATTKKVQDALKDTDDAEAQSTATESSDSMVPQLDPEEALNAGLRVNVRDVINDRKAKQAQYEADKAQMKVSGGVRLTRLNMNKTDEDKVTPMDYHVQFITPFDKGFELFVHLWDLDESNPLDVKNIRIHKLCEITYGKDRKCKICAKKGNDGNLYAVPSRCYLGYVFNFVGKTWERKSDKKVFEMQPLKLIEIPLGRDDKNLIPLSEGARHNYFHGGWTLTRKDGPFAAPVSMTRDELEAIYSPAVLEIPEKFKGLRTLQGKELLKTILGTFDDVEYDSLGFKAPAVTAK